MKSCLLCCTHTNNNTHTHNQLSDMQHKACSEWMCPVNNWCVLFIHVCIDVRNMATSWERVKERERERESTFSHFCWHDLHHDIYEFVPYTNNMVTPAILFNILMFLLHPSSLPCSLSCCCSTLSLFLLYSLSLFLWWYSLFLWLYYLSLSVVLSLFFCGTLSFCGCIISLFLRYPLSGMVYKSLTIFFVEPLKDPHPNLSFVLSISFIINNLSLCLSPSPSLSL